MIGQHARGMLSGFGSLVASTVTAATITATGRVILPAGSASDCSLQFDGDPNTGIFTSGADIMQFVTAGSAPAVCVAGAINVSTINVGGNAVVSNAVYLLEMGAAPGALANYSIIYSLDAATKTQLNTKQGAAGTVTPLAIEV